MPLGTHVPGKVGRTRRPASQEICHRSWSRASASGGVFRRDVNSRWARQGRWRRASDDRGDGWTRSGFLALANALDHARRRGIGPSAATLAASAAYDQWTVAGELDGHRPLWRIALDDEADTELYVSSVTGEIVQATTRRARRWNYVGSSAHWIYPTALRSRPAARTAAVWAIALAASIAALAGAVIGVLRIIPRRARPTPCRGWHALHHLLGLACGIFVLSWIVSGWLSMDDCLLFSSGRLNDTETAMIGAPSWTALPAGPPHGPSAQVREIEWFFFDGMPYRRERTDVATQLLFREVRGEEAWPPGAFLTLTEVQGQARRLGPACSVARIDLAADPYATAPSTPGAPAYRISCGDLWYDIDGASGATIDRLDPLRRAHRWLFGALHRLDIPYLAARPALRGALIVMLCGCGLAFSLTGCVIAWRRARLWMSGKRGRAMG
jgi:hypothetical protein